MRTHITLESPAVVHGKDQDHVMATVEGFGESVEVLRLRRPGILWYRIVSTYQLTDLKGMATRSRPSLVKIALTSR